MASATIWHLLTNPPVADYPSPATIISATTPDFGRLTTQLLDPAIPATGATQAFTTLTFPTARNALNEKAITSITVANPTVITATAHGFSNGDVVAIFGSNTSPTIDGVWTVSSVTTNTFTIPVNVTLVNSEVATVQKTSRIVYGRWITRQLPAQTISAGNWSFYGMQRSSGTGTPWGNTTTSNVNLIWGMCVAQWRAGTGVVARFLDSPSGGTGQSASTNYDRAQTTTVAGGTLTLAANDQIVLEVWSSCWYDNGSSPITLALLYDGLGQYETYNYTTGTFADTDAVLVAPQAITYS